MSGKHCDSYSRGRKLSQDRTHSVLLTEGLLLSFSLSSDKYTLYPEILGQGANSLVAVAEEKSSLKTYAVKVFFFIMTKLLKNAVWRSVFLCI